MCCLACFVIPEAGCSSLYDSVAKSSKNIRNVHLPLLNRFLPPLSPNRPNPELNTRMMHCVLSSSNRIHSSDNCAVGKCFGDSVRAFGFASETQVTNMSHSKAMAYIRQASWPLVLRFRLPLEERDVFSLSKIADMRYCCWHMSSASVPHRRDRPHPSRNSSMAKSAEECGASQEAHHMQYTHTHWKSWPLSSLLFASLPRPFPGFVTAPFLAL